MPRAVNIRPVGAEDAVAAFHHDWRFTVRQHERDLIAVISAGFVVGRPGLPCRTPGGVAGLGVDGDEAVLDERVVGHGLLAEKEIAVGGGAVHVGRSSSTGEREKHRNSKNCCKELLHGGWFPC